MEGRGIMKQKPSLLICSCHSTEHQMIFLFDEWDDTDGAVYIHTHLNKGGFWYRLKYAVKYIFGHQSRYGAFDEFIIKPEDANEFEKVIKYLKRNEIK